ncbi:MAG: hypothetical protein CMP48_19765 [Rickettsiales bacterium]|nr:hypothetical protein [Rickettsiales bacterium]
MRNVRDNFILYISFVLLTLHSFSQQVTVKGGFVQDSVRIGEDIEYWMSASYPEALDIVLPDTLYSFTPWEFSDKKYIPGLLKNGMVYDSAVYTLQSYEIDEVQYLTLPAFLVKSADDTVVIEGTLDSIIFTTMLPPATDTLSLKTNLAYQDVDSMVNYPLIWIILGILLVVAVVGLLVFGKRIQKAFKLRKLKKEYQKFTQQLSINIQELRKSPNQSLAEKTLGEWKAFLETMEKRPFTKLTTKEIMSLEYTNELNGTLKNIDRCVYGGIIDDNLFKDFQAIDDFTQHRYTVITDQIKNS